MLFYISDPGAASLPFTEPLYYLLTLKVAKKFEESSMILNSVVYSYFLANS